MEGHQPNIKQANPKETHQFSSKNKAQFMKNLQVPNVVNILAIKKTYTQPECAPPTRCNRDCTMGLLQMTPKAFESKASSLEKEKATKPLHIALKLTNGYKWLILPKHFGWYSKGAAVASCNKQAGCSKC
jgi:hypothetical protein